MTSESPSTSKADEPENTTTVTDASGGEGETTPRSRPARARTSSPTRTAPRQRARPDAPAGGSAGSPATQARPRVRTGAAATPPAPRPEPFRTRRLEETPGPNREADVDSVRLAIGVLVGVHGIRGELRIQLWTDAPEHLRNVRKVWIGAERAPRWLSGVRFIKDRGLIRLSGVGTPEVARTMVGQRVFIAGADARPLDENELFLYQLVGLRVIQEDGEAVGEIVDVIETGANDVLVIRPPEGGQDVLFPHHRDFVVGVDLAAGTMTVRPLEYLN